MLVIDQIDLSSLFHNIKCPMLTSHGGWEFSNNKYINIYIYIYTYKEHLVEIIYTLVGSELFKKINFKLAKPQN